MAAAMREETRELDKFHLNHNNVYKSLRVKKRRVDLEEGRCMRGRTVQDLVVKRKVNIKSYMEGIMNVENTWDNKTSDAFSVEGSVMPISDIEVSSAIRMSKNRKASGFSS